MDKGNKIKAFFQVVGIGVGIFVLFAAAVPSGLAPWVRGLMALLGIGWIASGAAALRNLIGKK